VVRGYYFGRPLDGTRTMATGGKQSESRAAICGLSAVAWLVAFATLGCELLSSVETHDGIQFQRGQAKVRSNGTVEKGVLARDSTIQGSLYAAGSSVEFSGTGRLSSATLARDTGIQGCVYAGGSSVEFTGEERVRRGNLAAACRTEAGGTIPRGTVEFDSASHDPSTVMLVEDAVVEGLKFKAKTQLTFRSSSKLLHGTLAAGNVFHGFELDEGAVRFDENGALKHAILGSQVRIGDVRLEAGTRVSFARDGRLSCARLQSAVFNLGSAHEKSEVCFDEEGNVTSRKSLAEHSP
jgi:hypothetical protein